MPKSITKLPKPAKIGTLDDKSFKPYQIRINITRELYNDIQTAKANEFKYLDDAEIAKIFLSRGAKSSLPAVDFSDITNSELSDSNLQIFDKGETDEDDLIDWTKAKPINWNQKS